VLKRGRAWHGVREGIGSPGLASLSIGLEMSCHKSNNSGSAKAHANNAVRSHTVPFESRWKSSSSPIEVGSVFFKTSFLTPNPPSMASVNGTQAFDSILISANIFLIRWSRPTFSHFLQVEPLTSLFGSVFWDVNERTTRFIMMENPVVLPLLSNFNNA
jgi:hypothetical protein